MARKVTITKEIILQNALDMLIEEGYRSLSIHTLAKRIGCSTQPIAWHFENMEGLRKALYEYASEYASNKTNLSGTTGADAFERLGRAYIETAIKEPNLFKFLYLGEGPVSKPYSISDLPKGKVNDELIAAISRETGLTPEASLRVVNNTVIYSHGIAAMLATGVFKSSAKQAMNMIKSASEAFVMKERASDGKN